MPRASGRRQLIGILRNLTVLISRNVRRTIPSQLQVISMQAPYKGRCLCGRVTFEINAEPVKISCCHCSNCKKYTGTVFTTNVIFPAGSYSVLTGQEFITVYHDDAQDSGNALPRHFCSKCGSPLFNTNGDFGRTMAVFYSALDGFECKAPEVEYYAKDRVEWLPEFPGSKKAKTKPGRD